MPTNVWPITLNSAKFACVKMFGPGLVLWRGVWSWPTKKITRTRHPTTTVRADFAASNLVCRSLYSWHDGVEMNEEKPGQLFLPDGKAQHRWQLVSMSPSSLGHYYNVSTRQHPSPHNSWTSCIMLRFSYSQPSPQIFSQSPFKH